jgi:hypothetical protein
MAEKIAPLLLVIFVLLALDGCADSPNDTGTDEIDAASPTNLNLPEGSTCVPGDQDPYVWRPARLQVIIPCVRVTGTLMEISEAEADGDIHMELLLDAPYVSLLTAGNERDDGHLVLEAVCQYTPPLIEALRSCASDPDPYRGPSPQIGDHIWVEGRYSLDLWHDSQAELHPLYRWGSVTP